MTLEHVENYPFSAETPTYLPQEWDNGSWTVQKWLERTAWHGLRGTQYGHGVEEKDIHPALFEDPLLRQIYLIDVCVFLGAERVSCDSVAGLLRCAPDESAKMFLGTQVLDECRHYEIFCRRVADFGVSPEQREKFVERYTTPAIRKFYALVLEQADKKDFLAGSIAQNLIMEGMAYPLYRYEIKYWERIDPSLSQMIRGAFADESHHVTFGESIIRQHLKGVDPERRNQLRRLIEDFSKLMTEAFEQVINTYVGLYQECASQYVDVMGDVEIFPGHLLGNVTEEQQVRLLLNEIKVEHANRCRRLGLA
jgi:hypothetical protein